MQYRTFQFKYSDLNIDLKKIEQVLGYGEGDDREIVDAVVADIMKDPSLFSNIRGEYKIYSNSAFIDSDKSISINSVNFQTYKIIYSQLKKAEAIAVILSTAGAEVGLRTRKAMSEGDPLTGYIYDMLGSLVVDATADLVQQELEKEVVSGGKKITNRYSPGYCGWDVSEQHKLFSLMPDNFCGIRLTESALMNPIKSLSGIIGIGEKVKFNDSTCSLCNMKQCAYRELKPVKS